MDMHIHIYICRHIYVYMPYRQWKLLGILVLAARAVAWLYRAGVFLMVFEGGVGGFRSTFLQRFFCCTVERFAARMSVCVGGCGTVFEHEPWGRVKVNVAPCLV